MKEFDTIKDLFEAVKRGDVDESKLEIMMDNDQTSFYEGGYDPDDDDQSNRIKVKEANGYFDIEKLYPLLFPKAKVEWV